MTLHYITLHYILPYVLLLRHVAFIKRVCCTILRYTLYIYTHHIKPNAKYVCYIIWIHTYIICVYNRIYIHVFDYSYMSSLNILNIPTESYSVTHFNFKVWSFMHMEVQPTNLHKHSWARTSSRVQVWGKESWSGFTIHACNVGELQAKISLW